MRYWCLIFFKVKWLEINHLSYFDFSRWLKELISRREVLRDCLRLFCIHPIFLFEFIFVGGLTLKMMKFVIPLRKLELKRSYINEDINFLIFSEFSRFYFDFSGIFWIYFIKNSKKGLFNRVGTAELMWHNAHTSRSHMRPRGRIKMLRLRLDGREPWKREIVAHRFHAIVAVWRNDIVCSLNTHDIVLKKVQNYQFKY